MKKILSFVILLCIMTTMFSFSAFSSGEITVISPGTSCSTDLSQIEVECENAEKIIFELDGVKIGETLGETVLPIEPGTITVGNHTLTVSAVFADKTAAQTSFEFNARKYVIIKSSTQDFNTYEAGSESKVGIALESKNGTFVAGTKTATLEPDVGASGMPDDKALKFQYQVNNWVSSNVPYFNYKNFTGYGAKGVVTFKFDLKMSDSSRSTIRVMDMPLMNGKIDLVSYGKINTTDFALGNEWQSVEIVHDYSRNNTTIYVDGDVAYDGTAGTNNYYKNTEVEITPMQLKTIPADNTDPSLRLAYWFDNFELKQELVYGIDSFLYDSCGSWELCDDIKIPSDTSGLKLILTEALDESTINTDTVSLYENGAKLALSDVTYNADEKSVTVTPVSHFSKGSEIVLKLSDSVKLSGGNPADIFLEARTTTEAPQLTPLSVNYNRNGSLLISSAQIEDGDVISADVKLNNDSDKEMPMTVMLYVRQNKKLRAIGAASAVLSSGEVRDVEIILPPIDKLDADGDVSVKMTVMDTFENATAYMGFEEIR